MGLLIPYMKPLDGRQELGKLFPLIDYKPFRGGTIIQSNIPGVFSHDDVGLNFCGLFADKGRSKYVKVVDILSDRKIFVDYEFDKIKKGKGYIFRDMSDALRAEFQQSDVRLIPYMRFDFVTTCYVAPNFKAHISESKTVTGGRVKLFSEECTEQETDVFTVQRDTDFDFSNEVNYVPPHTTKRKTEPIKRFLLGGKADGHVGTTSFLNIDSYAEFRAIENGMGLTNEFFTLQTTRQGRGGRMDEGKFYIQEFDNGHFAGDRCLGNLTTLPRGGMMLKAKNCGFDYEHETLHAPTFQQGKARISDDRSEYHVDNSYPLIIEFEGINPIDTIAKGGGNRQNIISIENGDRTLVFNANSEGIRHGEFSGWYEEWFGTGKEWDKGFTDHSIIMTEFIPVKGGQYEVYKESDNVIRTMGRQLRPLAMQIGDRFKAGDQEYTVLRKERGKYPDFGGAWTFFYLVLNKSLPLGSVLEIEYTHSEGEKLLDRKSRDAILAYKGNKGFADFDYAPDKGLIEGVRYDDYVIKRSDPYGHLAYSHAEVTLWFEDCDFRNGFYRQNNGKIESMDSYCKGVWLINCKNGIKGSPNWGFSGSANFRKAFAAQKGVEQKYDTLPKPPKYYILNSPDTYVDSEIEEIEYSVEYLKE